MSRKVLSSTSYSEDDFAVKLVLWEADDDPGPVFDSERVMEIRLSKGTHAASALVPLTTFEGLVITALRVIPRWEEMFQWRLRQDAAPTFQERMAAKAAERVDAGKCPAYVNFGKGHQSSDWCYLDPPHDGEPHALDPRIYFADIEWDDPPPGKEAFHDHGWA